MTLQKYRFCVTESLDDPLPFFLDKHDAAKIAIEGNVIVEYTRIMRDEVELDGHDEHGLERGGADNTCRDPQGRKCGCMWWMGMANYREGCQIVVLFAARRCALALISCRMQK